MVIKQSGTYSPDSSKYGTVTDGEGTLSVITTTLGSAKQASGSKAPDGSIYFTLTDGDSSLV